ncbi:Hypothetical predicted protein [Olea europaea subsp. europaea]|uniref:Uncharacterized protein n=1 Tax=Olea europaea subsp. europaea TaxID=158383 RepID=A0A8S0PUW0_OLEEU|nr:Hypothetical predicted protein [Olea europaea subsp. europaea]
MVPPPSTQISAPPPLSNIGTPLSSDENFTPFFNLKSCNEEMDFMETLFQNNHSIDSIPIDHCQPMNPVEGTSENTYSFNIDENYNHPTIFFTSLEILQTTDSQLLAVEYVENDLFHYAPNPMGNKISHSENSDLTMEFNSNFQSVETEASQIYPNELCFSYQWDGGNAGSVNLTTNLPTINQAWMSPGHRVDTVSKNNIEKSGNKDVSLQHPGHGLHTVSRKLPENQAASLPRTRRVPNIACTLCSRNFLKIH